MLMINFSRKANQSAQVDSLCRQSHQLLPHFFLFIQLSSIVNHDQLWSEFDPCAKLESKDFCGAYHTSAGKNSHLDSLCILMDCSQVCH